jgi:hypothetical protein
MTKAAVVGAVVAAAGVEEAEVEVEEEDHQHNRIHLEERGQHQSPSNQLTLSAGRAERKGTDQTLARQNKFISQTLSTLLR